jgi:hypothetical protein
MLLGETIRRFVCETVLHIRTQYTYSKKGDGFGKNKKGKKKRGEGCLFS